MTYQEKLDAAIVLIQEQNDVIGKEGSGRIDIEKFKTVLKAYGAISVDDLNKLSWEDILNLFDASYVSTPVLAPKLLAQRLAKVFRDKVESTEEERRPVTTKKAERMTLRELVECFDPEEFGSPVALRLKAYTKDQPFIVFAEGRMVDVETTFKLVSEIKSGWEGPKTVEVKGVIKPVYRIGELPDNYADENPIYVGRPLRPDGTCDQTGRSWAGVELKVRQFVRLALEKGFIKANIDNAHDVLDRALQPDALPKLRQRYRDISILFDELEKTGKLPRLQIALKSQKNMGGQGRPFDDGKRVEWVVPSQPHANYYSATLSSNIARR